VSNKAFSEDPIMRDKDRANDSVGRLDRRLQTLNESYIAYFQARSEHDFLQSVCESLVSADEFLLAWVGYCEHNPEKIVRPVAKAGLGVDHLDHVKVSWGDLEIGQGPFGDAIRTGRPCWINDIQTDPRFALWRAAASACGFSSCIVFPLILPGEEKGTHDVLGSLNLYSATPYAFDDKTIGHYSALVSYAALAVATFRRGLADDLIQGVTALRVSEERRRALDAQSATRAELERVTSLMTKGEMAAAIAHEVKQPLTAIVANAKAGLRWLGNQPSNPEEVASALNRIAGESQRASDVIDGIRAIFKQESHQKTRLDVNEVIREVVALLQAEIRNGQVLVQSDLAQGLAKVLASRVQLQQLIFNLLKNAIDAMRPVTDRVRELRIASAMHQTDAVLISVEDSGIGIDTKNIDRIFDPFFTTKLRGMGMGLSICRSIVEAHNGRLFALPRPLNGSIFRVILPIAQSTNLI
jgi:signal transduction histidine kinase